MNERRFESRYLCADLVRVSWREEEKDDIQTSHAVLEDISARGVCVQMEQPVPEGTKVQAHLGSHDFEGQVCYCSFQQIGYFIGVNFDDQARWNRHVYEPSHLTDLLDLATKGK